MEMADILFKKGSTVITAPPDATVLTAAKIMTKNKIGLLLTCSQPGRLIGWISDATSSASSPSRPLTFPS